MKKGLVISVVLLLASISVIGCGVPREEYDAVIADKEAAEAEIASLQSQLDKAQSELTKVKGDLAEAQNELIRVQNDIEATESELAAAQKQVSSLQSELSSVRSQISSLKSELATVQSRIEAAEARIAELETTNEEKRTLKIGMSTPSSGPAAEKGAPMGHANLDCIKYVNKELGGVAGYQIEVLWLDNSYDASKAVTIIQRFIDEDCLFFTTASSAMISAMMEIANNYEFPGFAAYSAQVLIHPPKHIYVQMPDYGDDWAAFAKYFVENIWEGPGKPKMALHLLNNPTGYGAQDAAKALADELGIEIVATEEHATTTTSEIESLTRIKKESPDILYISSTPAPTAIIIKNAVELGLYPGMTIACGHASFTKALVDLDGADVVEGVYGVYPTVNWGDDVSAMAKMTEYCQKYHPDDYGNMDYIISWAQSLIVVEILRLAVENAGIDNLTPQVVEEQGFKKLKDFDVGGLHGPISYSPSDNRLSKSVRVFQIRDGKLVPISGWVGAPLIKYEDLDWFSK